MRVLLSVVMLMLGAGSAVEAAECTLIRDEITAYGRICYYSCLGERRETTIDRAQRCPREVEVPRDIEEERERTRDDNDGDPQSQDIPESGRLN